MVQIPLQFLLDLIREVKGQNSPPSGLDWLNQPRQTLSIPKDPVDELIEGLNMNTTEDPEESNMF